MRSWSAPGFKAVVGAAFSSSISDLVSNRQTRAKGNLCESSEPGLCVLLGQMPTGPTSRSGTKGPSGLSGLPVCARSGRAGAANLWEETPLGAECLLHARSVAEGSPRVALCGGCQRRSGERQGLSLRVRLH